MTVVVIVSKTAHPVQKVAASNVRLRPLALSAVTAQSAASVKIALEVTTVAAPAMVAEISHHAALVAQARTASAIVAVARTHRQATASALNAAVNARAKA